MAAQYQQLGPVPLFNKHRSKFLYLGICCAVLGLKLSLLFFYWNGAFSYDVKSTDDPLVDTKKGVEQTSGTMAPKDETAAESGAAMPCPNSGAGYGDDYCAEVPKGLLGRQAVDKSFPNITELERTLATVARGGEWRPEGCRPRQQVAVLVPYRDRPNHLRAFLHNIHPFLQRQQLHYRIFVINQAEPEAKPAADRFNRAKLMNVGFLELERRTNRYAWDCLIFHDVDLVPEHDHNFYRCDRRQPKHLFSGLDEHKYIVSYAQFFGAVNALTPKQFVSVNGFSNHYWGYGGEDDDFYTRVVEANGYKPIRPPAPIGYYGHLKTAFRPKDETNPWIERSCMNALRGGAATRWVSDGLNSLDGRYKVLGYEQHKLYTNISVGIGSPKTMRKHFVQVDLLMEESQKRPDFPCKDI